MKLTEEVLAMKRKAFLRGMAWLGGWVLLAMAALTVVLSLFHLHVFKKPLLAAAIGAAVLLMVSTGLCVLWAAKTLKLRQRGSFVLQKGENGTIGVSLHAIEKQVYACVGKHDLIQKADVAIEEGRAGLIIHLQVEQASGVNIPLSVGLLQRQVRQYVTSCSGVDVEEVRVMVETGTEKMVDSPYAVQDVVMAEAQRDLASKPAAAAHVAEEEPAEEPEKEIAVPAPQVMLPPLPAMPEYEEEDDRPLHQRLFGAEEEPVFVPAPPVMAEEEAQQEMEIILNTELDTDSEEADREDEAQSEEDDVLNTLY